MKREIKSTIQAFEQLNKAASDVARTYTKNVLLSKKEIEEAFAALKEEERLEESRKTGLIFAWSYAASAILFVVALAVLIYLINK